MKTWRNKEANRRYLAWISNAMRKNGYLLVFDTETTGLGKTAKIIEFAGVLYQITPTGYKKVEQVDVFINPEEKLDPKITEITGITDYVLAGARTEDKEAPEILRLFEKADVWAAYNCRFDLRMMDQMCERLGIPFQHKDCIDILEMARDCITKEECSSHKLGEITAYLFPDKNFQFHCALDDTYAAMHCMCRFIQMYKEAFSETQEEKRQIHLEYAFYAVNPRKPSEKRIKLQLSEGDRGDVFWDVIGHTWSCKSDRKIQKMFQALDMGNLESQFMRKYGYMGNTMDDIVKEFECRWKEKQKARQAS